MFTESAGWGKASIILNVLEPLLLAMLSRDMLPHDLACSAVCALSFTAHSDELEVRHDDIFPTEIP